MLRLGLLALLLLPLGCRVWEPLQPRQSGTCTDDGDCPLGICRSGACDSTLCRRDEQCSSLLCVGNVDGGPPGTCGVRQCNVDADCGRPGRVCEASPTGNICAGTCGSDDECESPKICEIDHGKGSCVSVACGSDEDCGAGKICINARSTGAYCTPGCHGDGDCSGGQHCYISAGFDYGQCNGVQQCTADSDCSGCLVCSSTDGSPGICITFSNGDGGGPPIVGDRTALQMRDNLQPAIDYMTSVHPDAKLVQVVGLQPRRDGSVDVSNPNNYTAFWTYGFVMGSGTTTHWASVRYLGASRKCGTVLDPDGSLSATQPIPTPLQMQDSSAVAAALLGHAPCSGLDGGSSESITYSTFDDDGGGKVTGFTYDGDIFIGEPYDLTGDFYCQ